MIPKSIQFIALFLCLLIEIDCQVLPYYGASKYFYVNEANAVVGSGTTTFSIPATFPISTAAHRMPFYGFMAGSHLKTQLNQNFYFLTDMPSFTSSSFTLNLYFYQVTATGVPIEYYGFYPGSFVKFRYLLVLNIFPDKFISISRLSIGIYPITANSNI